jgi:uncharacterized protein YegP (UPF0339 family)
MDGFHYAAMCDITHLCPISPNLRLPIVVTRMAMNEKNGKNYFVLKAKNHQVIGKSQMYESASGMENGIKSVMTNGETQTIKDETL